MRLVTWNINSVRIRTHHVEKLVNTYQPDIICLQEIKCQNDQFPAKEFENLGYPHQEIKGQKALHGVATVSRYPLLRDTTEDFDGTGEARHLAVRLQPYEGFNHAPIIHNFYVPAGGDVPDPEVNNRFKNKMTYLQAMEKYFARAANDNLQGEALLVGDLNIAPLETDVWSHKKMLKIVSHTPQEVEMLNAVQASGNWIDAMRECIPPEEKLFTWWSYRAKDWKASNRGRRLDHIWVSPGELSKKINQIQVIEEMRSVKKPSDHAPVMVDFDVSSSR